MSSAFKVGGIPAGFSDRARFSGLEVVENDTHHDAGALDTGFAVTNLGIDGNALARSGGRFRAISSSFVSLNFVSVLVSHSGLLNVFERPLVRL